MKKDKIICFGEILWDLLPGGRQLGGAPFNVAHSLNKDFEVSLVSAIGTDQNGQDIEKDFRSRVNVTRWCCETEALSYWNSCRGTRFKRSS